MCAALLAAGATQADDRAVIISQGDTAIRIFDVKQAVNAQVPPESRIQIYGNEKKLREFVGSMFVRAKLAEYATKRELTAAEQWRIDEAERRMLSQIEIERQIAERGEPDFEKYVKEIYIGSPERFMVPAAVRAQHVLISNENRSDEEARAIATSVYESAKAGTPFEELVIEFSDDHSKEKNKGDLGFFTTGQMVKAFEQAAFALKEPGDLAGPVKTQFGYHVIRLVEKRAERRREFDEVKASLIKAEQDRHRVTVVNELIENVGALDGVVVNDEALNSLIQRPPTASGR